MAWLVARPETLGRIRRTAQTESKASVCRSSASYTATGRGRAMFNWILEVLTSVHNAHGRLESRCGPSGGAGLAGSVLALS